jgi:hypothetical protein
MALGLYLLSTNRENFEATDTLAAMLLDPVPSNPLLVCQCLLGYHDTDLGGKLHQKEMVVCPLSVDSR